MTTRILAVACASLAIAGSAIAQQADSSFRFAISEPAFSIGTGPVVCIDEAHANMHTATGTYLPFATLLRDDGYRVQSLTAWSRAALQPCAVVAIANAVAPANVRDRSLPHPPAFSKPEFDTLIAWIGEGGGLLLIADHTPFPGAVGALGLVLGVGMLDAFAAPGDSGGVIAIFGTQNLSDSTWRRYATDRLIQFRSVAGALTNPGTLGSHAILRGRNDREGVRWVTTFTGHAFYASTRVAPLLIFGPRAVAGIDRADAAWFPIGGWLQAGAIEFGSGRAVVLGEATTCTAQVGGPRRIRTGMNVPEAPDNVRFCLNVVHWLTKVLN